jgi:hypothetical protein
MRYIFDRWTPQELSSAGIQFKESFSPKFDPHDDYRVIYEASFAPATLDKARFEFCITDTGHVAVGIETYDRIARRSGLKVIRHGFAAGHEPRTTTKEGLRRLFDAVTFGHVFIVFRRLIWLATSARLYVAASDYEAIAQYGYQCSDWMSPTSGAPLRKVLYYRPW